MTKQDIGNRIRSLRGRESRPSFAGRFGVSVATLARYETGETAPNALFIMSLCEKYGVGTDWLLYGQGAGSPEKKEEGGEAPGPGQTGLRGPEPERAGADGPPFSEARPRPAPKNETGHSNLMALTKTLDGDDFDRLWNQFKSESEAQRGWLQIELIKRFPEFLEWLESRSAPLSLPPSAALNDEPPFPYLRPAFPPED